MEESKHVCIIAEAGVNHNGSMDQAKKLVDVAAEAGVDYVKFQTFQAEKLVSKEARKAKYQAKNLGEDEDTPQYEMLKELELGEGQHRELIDYCAQKNIRFLSTPFDEESIQLLVELGVPYLKVPSGELTNKPFLEVIGDQGIPVILSTGMGTLAEVRDALDVITSRGLPLAEITVLHCNTEYPTPYEDVNLRAMNAMRNEFGVDVGYSDHTLGIEVPIAATALGATVIEKHFTLDRGLPGPDHRASLEPDELISMVESIRNIESALGDGSKQPSESEQKNISVVRKSIHAAKDIPEGSKIGRDDLTVLRPGDGISPMEIDKILGTRPSRPISRGHKLDWGDIQ